jgi:hypothetical protein
VKIDYWYFKIDKQDVYETRDYLNFNLNGFLIKPNEITAFLAKKLLALLLFGHLLL